MLFQGILCNPRAYILAKLLPVPHMWGCKSILNESLDLNMLATAIRLLVPHDWRWQCLCAVVVIIMACITKCGTYRATISIWYLKCCRFAIWSLNSFSYLQRMRRTGRPSLSVHAPRIILPVDPFAATLSHESSWIRSASLLHDDTDEQFGHFRGNISARTCSQHSQ